MTDTTIHFANGWLLDPLLLASYREALSDPCWKLPSNDARTEAVQTYRAEWESCGDALIKDMQRLLNLSFAERDITVYVVHAIQGARSHPLIINAHHQNNPVRVVDIITHELLHRLLTGNEEGIDLKRILWEEMFPEEGRTVQNHVVLHATHQLLYLNTLQEPERLAAERVRMKKYSDYNRAWEIVDERGAEALLKEFMSRY